ncbi:MAG: hypothetical protein IPK14_25480 [Blastocatellia bacterium]|nr:hypothetical protein [Blastocatellia bacterium]
MSRMWKMLTKQPQMRSRIVESLNGEIEIERPYFYCKSCQKGYQPYDEEMKIAPQKNNMICKGQQQNYLVKYHTKEQAKYLSD